MEGKEQELAVDGGQFRIDVLSDVLLQVVVGDEPCPAGGSVAKTKVSHPTDKLFIQSYMYLMPSTHMVLLEDS